MTICGLNCCEKCSLFGSECDGCEKTCGHPCGGDCVAEKLISKGSVKAFLKEKQQIISEINNLGIENLNVSDLNLLIGSYVNLEYPIGNGKEVKFLTDNKVYFGNQIEIDGSDRCFGVVADEEMILVCRYGCMGENPEIVLYKLRTV